MNKYSIVSQDYGDEDREIIIFDVIDNNTKTIVFSSNSENEAQKWISEQGAINSKLQKLSLAVM
jgi:hypothetical protein